MSIASGAYTVVSTAADGVKTGASYAANERHTQWTRSKTVLRQLEKNVTQPCISLHHFGTPSEQIWIERRKRYKKFTICTGKGMMQPEQEKVLAGLIINYKPDKLILS